jgi:hypothetical protein
VLTSYNYTYVELQMRLTRVSVQIVRWVWYNINVYICALHKLHLKIIVWEQLFWNTAKANSVCIYVDLARIQMSKCLVKSVCVSTLLCRSCDKRGKLAGVEGRAKLAGADGRMCTTSHEQERVLNNARRYNQTAMRRRGSAWNIISVTTKSRKDS